MLRLSYLALAMSALATSGHAQTMEGVAVVVDGDTIEMTGTRIRLVGIDAPEAKQSCQKDGSDWACGEEATGSLSSIIDGKPIVCVAQAIDVYGRTIARCRNRIFDLGQEQLRRGMAIALDGAPEEYKDASAIAQRLRSGIWSSSFEIPADWRAANRTEEPSVERRLERPEQRTSRPRERVFRNSYGCTIKGNRSRRGEWIYHLPGMPYYEQTRAEEMFCTESEARAAGYRRSRAE